MKHALQTFMLKKIGSVNLVYKINMEKLHQLLQTSRILNYQVNKTDESKTSISIT